MNKKLVMVVIIMSIVVSAFARPKHGENKPNAETMLQHMSERLDLTAEQKASIKPILEEKVKLMDEFHSQRQQNNDSKQQEFQTQRKKLDDKINSFLTEEQQEEYSKFHENTPRNKRKQN